MSSGSSTNHHLPPSNLLANPCERVNQMAAAAICSKLLLRREAGVVLQHRLGLAGVKPSLSPFSDKAPSLGSSVAFNFSSLAMGQNPDN